MASYEDNNNKASAAAPRSRTKRHPVPSDEMIRNSIARSLNQILVNMVNKDYQQHCRELLQVNDLKQGVHMKIVRALEEIDAEREQRVHSAKERKQRTSNH